MPETDWGLMRGLNGADRRINALSALLTSLPTDARDQLVDFEQTRRMYWLEVYNRRVP
jgi:hypothetical protein